MDMQKIWEEKLKLFLYSSEGRVFISRDSPSYKPLIDKKIILSIVKLSPENLIKLLESVDKDNLLRRKKNIFYVFLVILFEQEISKEIKLQIKNAILDFCQTDEDFFLFIECYMKYCPNKSKFSSSLQKIVLNFYNRKSPLEFARSVSRQKSYHNWRHKDLIKLCHMKCDNMLKDMIVKYVLFDKLDVQEQNNSEAKEILDVIQKYQELRITEDANKAAVLITETHASYMQINPKLHKNDKVWLSLISEMSTRDILKSLTNFYKMKFLKNGTTSQSKVVDALVDARKIQSSNLHPAEVFIYLRQFQKGGKPLDPKLVNYIKEHGARNVENLAQKEIKCPIIENNIKKCLCLSYNNVKPCGKKFLLAIDTTDRMQSLCFFDKIITAFEAACVFTKFLLKTEKNVSVGVFINDQFELVNLNKNFTFEQVVQKLKEFKSIFCMPSSAVNFALHKKKVVDVFINFCSNTTTTHPSKELKDSKIGESLNRYRKKMKSPHTKLINVWLTNNAVSNVDSTFGTLDVVGFMPEVPKVLECFYKDHFN